MYHFLLIFLRDYFTFQTFILCTMMKYFIYMLIVTVYFKQYHLKLTHYIELNNQNSEVKKTIRPCWCSYFKFKFIPYINMNKLVVLFMFTNFNNYKCNLILHNVLI